jgi:hypothetical protein
VRRDDSHSERQLGDCVDGAVVDALYEGDGRAAAKDTSSSDEPADELERLRQLRSVFAELKANQEEPPPAGMALLMAAARQAALQRRPPGLWARLSAGWRALATHPGLAAAAAGVVVIGASGYMLTRNEGKFVETAQVDMTATAGSAAPAATSPRVPVGAATGTGDVDRRDSAAPSVAAPMQDPKAGGAGDGFGLGGAADERDGKNERGDTSRSQLGSEKAVSGAPRKRASEASPSRGVKAGKAELPADDVGVDLPREVPAAKPAPAPVSQGRSQDRAGAGVAVPASPAPPPPPGTRTPLDGESDEAREEPPSPSPDSDLRRPAERWYQLAKAAAAKGDCEAVRLLATRVKKEDPGFFDRRFLADPALRACVAPSSRN